MEITYTGRDGALTTYKITGATAELIELVQDEVHYIPRVDEANGIIEGSANKRNLIKFDQFIERLTRKDEATKAKPAPSPKAKTGRYVELMANAERDGLSHGKGWICTEFHIETKGACPSWEGEVICYVYQN